MKVLKIREKDKLAEWLEIEDDLDTYYKEMSCDTIDTITLRHADNGDRIVLIVDDNGKAKRRPPTMMLHRNGTLLDYIVGDVLVVRVNAEGETLSLCEEDYEVVKEYML